MVVRRRAVLILVMLFSVKGFAQVDRCENMFGMASSPEAFLLEWPPSIKLRALRLSELEREPHIANAIQALIALMPYGVVRPRGPAAEHLRTLDTRHGEALFSGRGPALNEVRGHLRFTQIADEDGPGAAARGFNSPHFGLTLHDPRSLVVQVISPSSFRREVRFYLNEAFSAEGQIAVNFAGNRLTILSERGDLARQFYGGTRYQELTLILSADLKVESLKIANGNRLSLRPLGWREIEMRLPSSL